MLTRRHFLASLSAAAAASTLPLHFAYGATPNDNRFIFVILRGAMDGLAAVAPVGDPAYATARGSIALPPDALLTLDSTFGLHPAMQPLYPLWQKGQMNIVHAVASPMQSRSHFDMQDVLESGGNGNDGIHNGWLGRAISQMQRDKAIAISPQLPLVLQGGKDYASSWYSKQMTQDHEDKFMMHVQKMYAQDAQLGSYLQRGLNAEETAAMALSNEDRKSGKKATDINQFAKAVKSCASFLKQTNGPRIAVLESAGWDTHARQGGIEGDLATRLGKLAQGLALLPDELGANVWNKSVVVVATEFGRTVHGNGTGGTDHGTASAAFVMGGALRHGGKVLGEWPGLSTERLQDKRDLAATTDMRSLFKTVLNQHFGLATDTLDSTIFPASGKAGIITQLI